MSFTRNIQDQERLIDCVRRALALMDAGETVHPLELCGEHPHLAGPLAEVLGLTSQLPELQQAALREDPLAGAVLAGRYRLAECLGRGAMGVVYRGEDQELRREVAVKILDVRLFRDPEAERRFQREAEALAALQHAHVVAVFDRGRTPEGIHFLVMERLEGATLATLLERITGGEPAVAAVRAVIGAEPAESHWPRLCARWACDLARGLAAAHAHELVHRDVKPSNVFLARPGRAVLLDFGIAARATDQRLTATQTTLGTPWYMAPEQVRGGVAAAEPTLDVYGLGATLYHLLAGRPPYEGDATAVLAALLVHEPTPLASVRADLPRDLVAIVEKCLERDPARRYQQALALAADLQAFLEHRPVSARPLGAIGRRLRQWRRAPARPVAVGAVGLAVLVAVVAGPILLRQRAAERRAAKEQLYATLPSLLAIEGWPDERVLSELRPEHETAVDLLDRILELDPTDVPALL
ncbi:MAG TPA: serine/threonine-protein kinase, partial [Planctomycetota bacterium]|nr:serine/threonine-protein kinase [Planctomycetota bacterium]